MSDGASVIQPPFDRKYAPAENLGAIGASFLDKRIQAYLASPTNTHVCVAYYGDSVAGGVGGPVMALLQENVVQDGGVSYGTFNLVSPGLFATFASFSTTGTVINNSTNAVDATVFAGDATKRDFTYLPSGDHVDLANGATAQIDIGQATGFATLKEYFATGPGLGTATVEFIDRTTAAVVQTTVVDCSVGASVSAAKATLSADVATKYKVKVTASGRVVWLMHAGLYAAGLLKWNAGAGGSALAQNNYSNAAILEYLRSDLSLCCVFTQSKGDVFADVDAALTRLTGLTGVSVIESGNGMPDISTVADGGAAYRALNKIIRASALAKGAMWFDAFEWSGSYANLVALGWQNDGTHPASEAQNALGRVVFSLLGLDNFVGARVLREVLNPRTTSTVFRVPRIDAVGAAAGSFIEFARAHGVTSTLAKLFNLRQVSFGDPGAGTVPGIAGFGSAAAALSSADAFIAFFCSELVVGGSSGGRIRSGTGSPEGVVSGIKSDVWLRTDGGAGTCFYVKETASGNTGWVAK